MAAGDHRKIITVADPAALADAAAERVLARMAANSGRIAICLTGGSSPKALYQLLATEPYRSRIPWDRVDWFIGDERFVPPTDPRNNMAMARRPFSTGTHRPPTSIRFRPIPARPTKAQSICTGTEVILRRGRVWTLPARCSMSC